MAAKAVIAETRAVAITEAKAELETMEAKVELATTETKAEPETMEARVEPEITETKAEPEIMVAREQATMLDRALVTMVRSLEVRMAIQIKKKICLYQSVLEM